MDLLSVPDLFADSCDLFAGVITPLEPMLRLAPPSIDHRLPDLSGVAQRRQNYPEVQAIRQWCIVRCWLLLGGYCSQRFRSFCIASPESL